MQDGQAQNPAFAQVKLAGLRLPADGEGRRRMPLPQERRTAEYEAAFDALTLAYDAVEVSGTINLFCPRLLNLWPVLRDGLRVNGRPVKMKRKVWLRFERLILPRGLAGEITLELDGQSYPLAVSNAEPAFFAGRNTLITMVKDTPTEWIADWLAYHASAQEAQGVILIDNGSQPDRLASTVEMLRQQSAIPRALVVEAPFPYGSAAGGRFVVPAKFLQVAMLNLMRHRFLGQARAILSVDVDEFVQPISPQSRHKTVFDMTAGSLTGCVAFTGHWAFPSQAGLPTLQRQHRQTDPNRPCRNPKWCLRPGSLSDRFPLAVHRPAGLLFPATVTQRVKYWHFAATSTGWKAPRLKKQVTGQDDPYLIQTLATHLA